MIDVWPWQSHYLDPTLTLLPLSDVMENKSLVPHLPPERLDVCPPTGLGVLGALGNMCQALQHWGVSKTTLPSDVTASSGGPRVPRAWLFPGRTHGFLIILTSMAY